MRYSAYIDQAAMSVARRMFKQSEDAEFGWQDLSNPRRNPLFYPCLIAFMLVGICAASPLDSALRHLSVSWLPSPVITWALLLCIIYPFARFCTTLLALRAR